MNTREVTLDGIKLIVRFRVYGRYIPQTYEYEAEYPELDIYDIKVEDSEIDIQELLSSDQINEIIEQLGE